MKLKDEFEKRLKAVDQATLRPLVRRLLEDDRVEVVRWRYRPVEGGFGESYGVYRFQGEAQTGGETAAWSLILKITGPERGSQAPAASDYWKREALVYQSGLLDDLAGDLAAPRCVGVAEYPGEEVWLWLEDIVESGDGTWPLERFGLAARHLGQFNGAYLAGKAVPDIPWLTSGQLQARIALAEPGMAELPRLSQHPVFEGLLPADGVERSLELWAERRRLLAALDRLPRSLCHHDAFRLNLIARRSREGREQTVAIDWATAGVGVIGEEIVGLFADSLRFVAVDIDKIAELGGLIFAGYLDGLRDAGWRDDSRLARLGYAATAALRSVVDQAIQWPEIARRVAALPAGAELPRLLSPGGPVQHAAVQDYLLDLGEEAGELVDALE